MVLLLSSKNSDIKFCCISEQHFPKLFAYFIVISHLHKLLFCFGIVIDTQFVLDFFSISEEENSNLIFPSTH